MSQVTSDNNIPISSPSTTENPTTEFSSLPPQAIGPLVIPVTSVNWLTPLRHEQQRLLIDIHFVVGDPENGSSQKLSKNKVYESCNGVC